MHRRLPQLHALGLFGRRLLGATSPRSLWPKVPASNTSLTTDSHPYSTATFVDDSSEWQTVSRDSVQSADALVYNSDGEGHIFLYDSGDGWGSMNVYEAKGCAYGILYDLRTASTAYHAIRHY